MSRVVRAARGTQLTAKSWQTEAALRMFHNNLDPDVAERPEDLVVYGGTGKAARNWASFDAITRELTTLDIDETLLVQSGTRFEFAMSTRGAHSCVRMTPTGRPDCTSSVSSSPRVVSVRVIASKLAQSRAALPVPP